MASSIAAAVALGFTAGASGLFAARQAVETYLVEGRLLGLDDDQLRTILHEEVERARARPDVTPAAALEAARIRALQAACAQEFARV